MDWRLKSAVRHLLLALPRGEQLYRWVTAELLGTNAGMAAKWFRVFPTHVHVLQELFGAEARQQRLWCFDSGATMAAGLAMALITDEPGLLTDRFDRLSNRYCAVSRTLLQEKGPALAQLSQAAPARIAHLLSVSAGKEAVPALQEVSMTYASSHGIAEDAGWRGSLGCVISVGALEHYTPEALEHEVARMAVAVKNGGVISHVVDHRDHRWHADKRISPLQHLTMGEEEYRRRFANSLEYHNRRLRSWYVALFARHGFQVEGRTVIAYTDDLPPLDRRMLALPFTQGAADDWQSLVTHFIGIRHGA